MIMMKCVVCDKTFFRTRQERTTHCSNTCANALTKRTDDDAIWNMYLNGKAVGTIARELGHSYHSVKRVIARRVAKLANYLQSDR